jgi:hypothetical protein
MIDQPSVRGRCLAANATEGHLIALHGDCTISATRAHGERALALNFLWSGSDVLAVP